jgi:hypothetical protein
MKLSTLSIILGLIMAAPNLFALINPARFTETARKFPRSVPIGCVLMLLATLWFVWNVRRESIADFESLKPVLYTLFIAVGIGSCVFVQDLLAARGVAVLLLLAAKLMVDTARWVDTPWRLVIVVLAYIWVIAGIWFTISPWRLRDLIHWSISNPKRLRIGAAVRLAFAVMVVVLGITVF